MKTYTMIMRHGKSNNEVAGYTLIDDNYNMVKVDTAKLVDKITKKEVEVTNLTVGKGGIESTNGALNNYTLVTNEGVFVVQPHAVILNRVEENDRLVGYTVFDHQGHVVEMNVATAANLANKHLVANGKVRHTQYGDIVSAINGNYPLRKITIDNAKHGDTKADVLHIVRVAGTKLNYVSILIKFTSAVDKTKIYDTIVKANKSAIESMTSAGAPDEELEAAQLLNMDAMSIFGTFDISILDALKANTKIKKASKLPISAVKYTSDCVEEITVVMYKEGKFIPTGKTRTNDEAFNEALKDICKIVKEKNYFA